MTTGAVDSQNCPTGPDRPGRGDLSETTIGRFPHGFISKKGEPILVVPLSEEHRARLVGMYLAFHPRNSFAGLPPADDAACVRWVEEMLATGISLVALCFNDGVIGHAALFPVDEGTCEMLVAVLPSHHQAGIGTELTNCVVQLAAELGFEKIVLSVEAHNHVARHVYVKCGFRYETRGFVDELDMSIDLRRHRVITSVPVSEVMNRHVAVLHPEMPCKVALMIFLEDGLDALPVTRAGGELVGVLSETELMVEENIHKKVREVHTRQVVTVGENCPLGQVISLFRSRSIRCIPVLNGRRKLVGVIRKKDILTYYLNRYAQRARGGPGAQGER